MGLRLRNSQGTGLIVAEILMKIKHHFYELLILLPYNGSEMNSERIFSKSSNKKGLWCPFNPVLCQEGYCHECQIYSDWQREEEIVKMTNHNKNNVSKQDTQAMKMRIRLVIASTFLVHCGGTWAYAFFIILQQGEVAFYEPNIPLAIVEFGVAVALTLMGLSFLGMAIWKR